MTSETKTVIINGHPYEETEDGTGTTTIETQLLKLYDSAVDLHAKHGVQVDRNHLDATMTTFLDETLAMIYHEPDFPKEIPLRALPILLLSLLVAREADARS